MKRTFLANLIRGIFCPGVIQIPQQQFLGALPDPASLGANLAAIAANGASAAGNVNFSSIAGAATTLTNLAETMTLLTAGAAVTVTLDSAYNICGRLPQPLAVGQTFRFRIATIAASTVATPTLSDTAVTLAGTTSCVANAVREYLGSITQVTSTAQLVPTAGTTFTSLTQVGATNNYTLALGTNAVVPAVGTLVYIGTTAGTLPAGWYPINKVTSAVSFVIAAPAAAVAWTCTAATIGNSQPAPATYSPLVTITGLMSVAGTVTA